jgi:sodium/potassium-transporting ATPase subunit alpha
LIDRCTHTTNVDGSLQTLDLITLAQVKELKDRWSSEGKRVILLARKLIPAKDIALNPSSREFEAEVINHARTGLVLVGMVGIVDPPREEIPDVIKTLRRAGIRIFMVSSNLLESSFDD